MATRGRDADDMIASLMQEMGQQRGYQDDNGSVEQEQEQDGNNITEEDRRLTEYLEQQRTSYRRLIPELSDYPDNTYKAGSQSIWNPMVIGECGSSFAAATRNDDTTSSSLMLPTNPRIEVIRRRVFEKFRQEAQTLLEEIQTRILSFSSSSSSSSPSDSSSFSKNKNKLPIPSMIEKWHMDAKLEERNFILKKVMTTTTMTKKSSNDNGNENEYQESSSSATSTGGILQERMRRKQQGKFVYDPILLNRQAPLIFVETILKPHVQKLWQQSGNGNNNELLPPKFNKKAQQVQKGLFRLICEAIDSFETQLHQDAQQESIRSTTKKMNRKNNKNNNKQPKISTTQTDSGSSSSLVRVSFSGVVLKLHDAYLEKLKRLYDRTKERQQQSGNISNSSHLSFEEALFCLLCRYDMIQGAGLQAGVPGAIMDVLLERFNCRMECFASPFNCRYDRFASAFVDVDAPFGSQGSFFELPFIPDDSDSGSDVSDNDDDDDDNTGICYQANPPFCEGLILQLNDKITRVLSSKRQQERPIMFAVFVPAWRESECYQALLANDYLEQHLLLKQGEHWYAEGTQHRRKDSFRVASFDTSILFYQNESAKKLWNVQKQQKGSGDNTITILDELREAFGQDPGTMQKEQQPAMKPRSNRTITKKSSTSTSAAVKPPARESEVANPSSFPVDSRRKKKKNSLNTLSSVTKKAATKVMKEQKRKWNQREEGKAQLDLLESLGLSSSSTTTQTTATNFLKTQTAANNNKSESNSAGNNEKLIPRKKKKRRKK